MKKYKKIILRSVHPEDLFGIDSSESYAKDLYLKLRSFFHPDKSKYDVTLFTTILGLWEEAENKFKNGTYGILTEKELNIDIQFKKDSYTLIKEFPDSDYCNVYKSINKDTGREVVIKSPVNDSDTDLIQNEDFVLTLLREGSSSEMFLEFTPEILKTYKLKSKKTVLVFPFYKSFSSLTNIANGDELKDTRHVIWIWKRILSLLYIIHSKGYIHGAILPQHVLIDGVTHGIKLIDWSYSIKYKSEKMKAIPSGFEDYYPKEVFDGDRQYTSTDIYVSAKTIIYLLGGDVKTNSMPSNIPLKLKRFISSCLISNHTRRDNSASDVYDGISKLGKELYGTKYIKLKTGE